MRFLLSILSLFTGFSVFSQGEFNNWYFGTNAGVSFATGAPLPLLNGALSTYEGCATISNSAGNLLFYTDGITVWNSNHVQMANGNNLNGNSSSAQSAIIVPWPGKANEYFIFTSDAGTVGIHYSVVDISMNGGLGAVTTKNVLLYTDARESLTAVKHSNGCDIWVLSHKWNSNDFYAHRVTSTGVNHTPVISSVGRVNGNGGAINSRIGYLKVNRQATKLALACVVNPTGTSLELFDFNNTTGVVSNPMALTTGFGQTYGCEFSPNGNLLYGSSGSVYQFDITLGTLAAINASKVVVGTGTYGALQVGPDNKMYQVTTNSFLNVINNPNTPGMGCNFVANAVGLGGKKGFLGLPNFITSWVAASPGTIEVADTCEGNNTQFSLTDTSGVLNLTWNFGDAASGANNTSNDLFASHTYPTAGTYSITLILNHTCKSDTIYRTVNIIPGVEVEIISSGAADCSGSSSTAELNANVTSGTAPYVYNWSQGSTNSSIQNLLVGIYSLTVTDDKGCKGDAEKTVTSEDEYTLYAPNTFTPNDDGINEFFLPTGACIEEYELFIFDRWGNFIFKSNDKTKGWNGKTHVNQVLAQQDTYIWRLKTKDSFGNEYKYFGHVNLIR